jgi:hypothetical protein
VGPLLVKERESLRAFVKIRPIMYHPFSARVHHPFSAKTRHPMGFTPAKVSLKRTGPAVFAAGESESVPFLLSLGRAIRG